MQPVLTLCGVIIPESRILHLSRDWVNLKKQYFPNLCTGTRTWDWHKAELKGTDVRESCRASRRRRRHAFGFLDRVFDLLDSHNCSLVSRTWIKSPGQSFDGVAVYSYSVQALCKNFQEFLSAKDSKGVVVADSRNPGPNTITAHSIFTQRVCRQGDPYTNIADIPLFGHSDNHAGLQIADIVASSLIAPICIQHFIGKRFASNHLNEKYDLLAKRFCPRLMQRHARYGPPHKLEGGMIISDKHGKRGASDLFNKYCRTTHPAPPASRPATSHR